MSKHHFLNFRPFDPLMGEKYSQLLFSVSVMQQSAAEKERGRSGNIRKGAKKRVSFLNVAKLPLICLFQLEQFFHKRHQNCMKITELDFFQRFISCIKFLKFLLDAEY